MRAVSRREPAERAREKRERKNGRGSTGRKGYARGFLVAPQPTAILLFHRVQQRVSLRPLRSRRCERGLKAGNARRRVFSYSLLGYV